MTDFDTRPLPAERDVVAPDGSDVRILLGLGGGGMAHFELAPGRTAGAAANVSRSAPSMGEFHELAENNVGSRVPQRCGLFLHTRREPFRRC